MTPPFTRSLRLPDPCIEVLDERFLPLRLLSGTVERLATGFYWAEGPVWVGDGRYLLMSDIPNNRIVRWDDCSGAVCDFRRPSNHANGLARDHQGRLLACEHLTRRVTRTEFDGRITVLADRYLGKPLNSPNDIVCQQQGAARGAIWFTDPPFGISGWWEGEPATPELPHGVYRIDPDSGDLEMALDDLQGSNGLAFSPDESVLYVVESRATPHRRIWAYDVDGATLRHKRLFADAGGPGAFDGIAVDVQGNLWCGFGSNGAPEADAAQLDGVRVFDRDGRLLAHIHLPERCANLCFGGARRNRLFMASSHSLYALYVNTRGAVA
ncbi:SMP-30/gluconolactonase/LRE family protein [Ideonella sp. A 288]|uniref:SMP-30/gluconolactonase/LRE family protein n=1 Tax=Ideonella sp. A 288 TaxID=1962181 RepID=UPI000B4B2E74|nr:SMP-30/gluconolactonase/LRE family protein [Ideonella sp. A 288]